MVKEGMEDYDDVIEIDLWTSRDVRKYLGMVLSVVDESLRVQHFNLPLIAIPAHQSATGEVIAPFIRSFFEDLDRRVKIEPGSILNRVKWITTDGSGRGNNLSCACNLLSKKHVSCVANLQKWLCDSRETHRAPYSMAREYLAIAPTEVAVERLFSHCGNLISDKRTRMKDDLINAILLVKLYSK